MSKYIEIEEEKHFIDEDFTYEKFVVEIRKKYQHDILHIITEIRDIRSDFENELINWIIPEIYLEDYDLEKGAIPSDYINLVSFLLIRRGLRERYTAICIMEYDYNESLPYIKPCIDTYMDMVLVRKWGDKLYKSVLKDK